MMELIFWLTLFVVALATLIKSSQIFTDSAEKIGVYLGLPAFLVGATIVAMGTSLPELMSGFIAVFSGAPEITIGNVIGANISNIFLVLGLSAIIARKITVTRDLIKVDLPAMVLSAFMFTLVIYDGTITTIETIILLLAFIAYMGYVVSFEKKEHEGEEKEKKRELEIMAIPLLIVSAIFIYLGAKLTIDSLLALSEMLSIGKEIIAATIFSIGTTLPELTVSITAAIKGKAEIAIGNILGSNVFNALVVFGLPSLLGTIVTGKAITVTMPFIFIGVLILSTIVYFFTTQDNEITMWEGFMLLGAYLIYIITIIGF